MECVTASCGTGMTDSRSRGLIVPKYASGQQEHGDEFLGVDGHAGAAVGGDHVAVVEELALDQTAHDGVALSLIHI